VKPPVSILGISGSLREASSNTAALKAVRALAAPEANVTLLAGLDALPHFNPDLDSALDIPSVLDFRRQIESSDAVVISSPEYAHGVPGTLKNALDWVVGSGELVDKPVALINTSQRAMHAQASLREILTTMSAVLVPEASVTLPLLGRKIDGAEIVADSELSSILIRALTALIYAVGSRR